MSAAQSDAKPKRPICPSCSKPARVCLCSRIRTRNLDNSVSVTILQHSLERNHPLNSTRIAKLGLKNLNVVTVFEVDFEARFEIRLLEPGLGLIGPECSGFDQVREMEITQKAGFEVKGDGQCQDEKNRDLIDENENPCEKLDKGSHVDAINGEGVVINATMIKYGVVRLAFPTKFSSSTTMQKLVSRPLSDPPKHFFSYFFSHSVSKTTYDPPFSPISKPPKPKPKPPDPTPNRKPTPIKSSLPFDFRHSYSETDPRVEPIGFREPKRFSPFGPGRLDREWTGTSAPVRDKVDSCLVEEERIRVLGDPLTEEEIEELVEKYRHNDCARQINLGKNGVTHNMLDDIHNHWKRAEAVRIKCLGVPTLDMDNVCFHLELSLEMLEVEECLLLAPFVIQDMMRGQIKILF
ncbi:hypothetical protein J1N35_028283 [Gossypium stocksii]|uniref:tRNA-uridine aminocarboxypropyltransferase n=1 Tax=Gossypium stocksii TaxID=47602 RepID=A0A9D3UVY0_9ROSI|nr:hypothetical protein J1N35_028283 [Gossypium stocksii]